MAAAFLGTAAYRLSVPAVAFFAREALGSTMLQLGLLTLSFFAARAVTALLTGRLADKGLRVGLAAAACFLIHAFVIMAYGLARSWIHVLLLRAVQGALNGVAWTAVQIALGASVRHEVRGRAFSIYFFSGSLGSFAGNAIYSCLARLPLQQLMFVSAAFLGLTAASTAGLGRVSLL